MLEKMKTIIAEQLSVDADSIQADSNFKEDLGADSLDLFELVMALEEEFGVEIPSEDLAFLETESVTEESEDQIRFDIAVDVYKTKQQEAKDSREEAAKKAHNQHIAEIIAEKEEAELRSKSVEELKAMMK